MTNSIFLTAKKMLRIAEEWRGWMGRIYGC